jgi:hypothetical protein
MPKRSDASRLRLIDNFDVKILDHWIAQDFEAGIVQLASGGCAIAGQFDFQVFSDVDGTDALITHLFQGSLHGLSLRIDHRFFRRNRYLCFHGLRGLLARQTHLAMMLKQPAVQRESFLETAAHAACAKEHTQQFAKH